MPAAARVTDNHKCPLHGGGPVAPAGEPTVLIGFKPAARVGDLATCGGPEDSIAAGEPSVIIGYKDAARLGDPTAHGGAIAEGCPTVLIGSSAQADALRTDRPFCAECEGNKRKSGGGA